MATLTAVGLGLVLLAWLGVLAVVGWGLGRHIGVGPRDPRSRL